MTYSNSGGVLIIAKENVGVDLVRFLGIGLRLDERAGTPGGWEKCEGMGADKNETGIWSGCVELKKECVSCLFYGSSVFTSSTQSIDKTRYQQKIVLSLRKQLLIL